MPQPLRPNCPNQLWIRPFPEALKQLTIASLGAAYAARLRFDSLSELPTEGLSEDLARRIGDRRWLVFHEDGHLVALVVECQSRIDDIMECRVTRYGADALEGLRLLGRWKKGDRSPEVATITVYNGDREWDGLDPITWHAPGGDGSGGSVKVTHALLDMQRYADREVPEEVLFHALSRAERYPGTFWKVVGGLRAHYRGPEQSALRPRLGRWLCERAGAANVPGIEEVRADTIMEEDMEAIEMRWKEYEDGRRAEFRAEGLAEGRAEGKAEGMAALGRFAARKFGAETAARLAAAWAPGDGRRLEEVADAIYECGSGAELLARIKRIA